MTTFQIFSKLVTAQFNKMSEQELFVVGDDNRVFEAQYLAAFPEGTNPTYKTNTEHDCSCCKQFIRNLGNLVAVIDGKRVSVWDVEGAPYPYDVVSLAMRQLVADLPITTVFRSTEPSYSVPNNKQLLEDGNVKVWDHFYGKVAARHFAGKDAATKAGEFNSAKAVFERGLKELSPGAIQEVRDLIAASALYRGEEHLGALQAFQTMQGQYLALSEDAQTSFAWAQAENRAARFRNTVIGTLVQDLSEGKPLEQAVASFEAKVAPTNYKRTTALVTPRMVQDAVSKLKELGLEHAIERRFAKISDITVNNVLWADSDTRSKMKNNVLETVAAKIGAVSATGKATDISIADFMSNVLPTAVSMEMLVKNQHQGNFVSLTAPVHEDSGKLFKWDNDFAWSYVGNITDSIKERVKIAGGNTTNAALRVSLAWYNHDDLDLHCTDPEGRRHYYGSRRESWCGLDVDMNAGYGSTRTPVENISLTKAKLKQGNYLFQVRQYSQRESSDVGFELEVEFNGKLQNFSYKSSVSGTIDALSISITKDGMVLNVLDKDLIGGTSSKEVWEVETEKPIKVQTVMYSPNYWDDNAVGNKHWIFMLEGCKADQPARGIYNEFLRSDLEAHRKVFEILGDKTKCEVTSNQLSGVGFSSTKRDEVAVVVTTATSKRTFNVKF